MKILLTNTYLVERAGTELYIRDVACGLLRLGHKPIVYSPRLGAVAEEIRAATVPVVDNLDALGEPPDLIHGQHHLEAMTALLRFPDVPAIFFSHGWQPWQEAPPRFSRILHYVAVDRTVRDRLIYEHGIPPGRVSTILNFVDLQRFQRRADLPVRPRRALVFGNHANEPYYQALAAACAERGISLDVAGRDLGAAADRPEALLPHYDLVFAKARAAMESMASGTAVILASPAGLGPLVTTANFDLLRPLNFGLRTLTQPCDPAHLIAEIDRYDAADARAVGEKMRQVGGLTLALDEIVQLYEEVLARWRAMPRDPATESRATSAYLRWFSKNYPEGLLGDLQRVDAARHQLHLEHTEQRERLEAARTASQQHAATIAWLQGEQQRLQDEGQELRRQLVTQDDDLMQVRTARDLLHSELTQLREALQEARASQLTAQSSGQIERDQLRAALAESRAEIRAMRGTRGWRALALWWRLKRLFQQRKSR